MAKKYSSRKTFKPVFLKKQVTKAVSKIPLRRFSIIKNSDKSYSFIKRDRFDKNSYNIRRRDENDWF